MCIHVPLVGVWGFKSDVKCNPFYHDDSVIYVQFINLYALISHLCINLTYKLYLKTSNCNIVLAHSNLHPFSKLYWVVIYW